MRKIILAVLIGFSFNLSAQKSISSISLKNLSGEEVNIKALTKEGLFVVSFWASWCVSCINELDEINDVYEDWQDELGVQLIAVATDDSRTVSRVTPMVNGKGWEYEVLFDTNQELKRSLNIGSVPYVLIVHDGEIVYQHSGYSPGQEDELFEELKKYTQEK